MAKSNLSKRRVDAAKPGETIWDGEIPGFGLRVSKGGAKSYVLKYRRGRLQRWYTIGRHGAPWTPHNARQEARRLLGAIANGDDPANEKQDVKQAETLTEFASRYLETHAKVHKKASSATEDERNLRNHILPVLGNHRMRDITRQEISRFHHAMRDRPYAANRCLALLSHMFKKAEAWGVRPDNSNPCLHVEKYSEKARERFLSTRELKKLGRTLAVVERAGNAPYVVAAIRLLLFTGARLGEILSLRWDYVDFEAQCLRLPDSKTGAKTIALSAPALQVLADVPRMADNPHIICGSKAGAALVNLQKPWRRIRKAAHIPDVRIHDLRHSYASVAVSGGMSLPLIGSLLGHSQPQTTQRYAHLADDPRHAAADAVAREIAASLSGGSSTVVPLNRIAAQQKGR